MMNDALGDPVFSPPLVLILSLSRWSYVHGQREREDISVKCPPEEERPLRICVCVCACDPPALCQWTYLLILFTKPVFDVLLLPAS